MLKSRSVLSSNNVESGNLYHYVGAAILNKKYYPVILGSHSMRANKRQYHTFKRNSSDNLKYKLLRVLLPGLFVFMFNMAIVSCIFFNLCKSNIVELNTSININIIYMYFLSLMLTFIFIALYDFLLKKIILFRFIKNRLPIEFISGLSNKMKIIDRFRYVLSLYFLKIFLLTSFFVLLPYLFYYILYYSFFSPYNLFILVIYILYISICINLAHCFFNSKSFFSKYNVCNIGYSFILLLFTKTTVMFLVPILLPFLVINSNCTGVKKHIVYLEKNTLKFLKKLPIVHKLVYIKINNNNSFLNSSLVKFKHHNHNTSLQLNSSNVKYIPFSNL